MGVLNERYDIIISSGKQWKADLKIAHDDLLVSLSGSGYPLASILH